MELKKLHLFFVTKTRLRWLCILVYIFLGFVLGSNLFKAENKKCITKHNVDTNNKNINHGSFHFMQSKGQTSSNIYVGMMSAGKYMTNRVQRALDTWLQKGKWKVEVFANANPSVVSVPPRIDFTIVTLPGVDDKAYPPQKKCIMMLRHMFDKHIDNYEWFLRVDDDSFIDYSRLSHLLSSINSSLPVFLGAPGFGLDSDDHVQTGMYYLMGGPGIIMSRGLLRKLRPRLSYCIQHMFSSHEDIEMGRCVWNEVKDAVTPIAWETLDYFYQHYDKVTGDVTNIELEDLPQDRMSKLISFHPVKSEALLFQLHKILLERKIQSYIRRTASLQNEIQRMIGLVKLKNGLKLPQQPNFELPIVMGINKDADPSFSFWPVHTPWSAPSPVIPQYTNHMVWQSWDKYFRHISDNDVPVKGHSKREQFALWQWMKRVEEKYLKAICPGFEKNPQFVNGYMKVTHFDGVFLTSTYKAYSDQGAKYCSVMYRMGYGVTLTDERQSKLMLPSRIKENAEACNISSPLDLASPSPACSPSETNVVIVIPLQGRYPELRRFMSRYEKDFLQPILSGSLQSPHVQLVIVLLGKDQDNFGLKQASLSLLRDYQRNYGSSLVRFHDADTGGRSFSRGAGIQIGSMVASPRDILFFMDIDMIVTPDHVHQCRAHVRQGDTAWYPISFSQYDPEKLCFEKELSRGVGYFPDRLQDAKGKILEKIKSTPMVLSKERGFWRDFGFGITCMFKSDFLGAGGFDLSILGWGEEDVKMYLSLLKSGLNIFRSKQVDLIHIFHAKDCPLSLVGEQRLSCQRTKFSHCASQQCLYEAYRNRVEKRNF